jgi:hypothetical protein
VVHYIKTEQLKSAATKSTTPASTDSSSTVKK